MHDEKITYFAETDSRNKRLPFGIKAKDRSRHVYVIGKTGMGKSTLLENMAVQDIQNGEGLAFIDPHGKTADLLLEYVPKERIKEVIYFAPFDTEYPISFNVMEDVGPTKRHLVANGLMSAFKKIWVDAWSARMEYILNNILLALLEYPDSTLIGVNRMLADKDYRRKVVENISDPSVKSFWVDEFAKYGEKYMQEAGAAIQNKIGQFISNPLVRNIIGQPKSSFDLRKVMDDKKIIIINLSKGRVGETNANLLGSMIITKIYLAALSRADVTESKLKTLPHFYLYVDEFQSFANESFADILSEARKYKLSLTVAHQYIEQMSEEVRAAVFGNVGTMIVFRVGAYDAEFLEKEFSPTFTAEDLVNLGFVQIYLKLMIDGVTSPPFSASTLPPIEKPDVMYREDIFENSRAVFAHPRSEVEKAIIKWHEPIVREERRMRDPSSPPTQENSRGNNPQNPRENFAPRAPSPSPSHQSPSHSHQAPESPRGETSAHGHDRPVPRPVRDFRELRTLAKPKPPREDGFDGKIRIPPISPAQSNEQRPRSENQQKPVSLDSLRKDKSPSQKNLSELKDALRNLVEKTKSEHPEKNEPKKAEEIKDAPPQETSKTTAAQKPPAELADRSKPNEVPEHVLRKILDIGNKK